MGTFFNFANWTLKLQFIIIIFLEHWNTLDWLVTLFCMFYLPVNSYLNLLCICLRVAYLGPYFVLPNLLSIVPKPM
jgi:hypothetical protein